mgnify:CR=1 FL=1
MNSNQLTIEWIKSTLKMRGVNSKKMVIDRLDNATHKDLYDLSQSAITNIYRRFLFIRECPFEKFMKERKENEK